MAFDQTARHQLDGPASFGNGTADGTMVSRHQLESIITTSQEYSFLDLLNLRTKTLNAKLLAM